MPGEGHHRRKAVEKMKELMDDLRKGKTGGSKNQIGSYELVKRTIDVLRRIIAHYKWKRTQDLLNVVRTEGKKIMEADPSEGCVGNVVRQVLGIVRKAFETVEEKGTKDRPCCDSEDSPPKKVTICDIDDPLCPIMETAVMDSIKELITKVDGCAEVIASHALKHIYADETILTFGYSRTVEAVLKNAARERQLHVIISEAEPLLSGHQLAKNLSDLGNIKVMLVPDTHVFMLMPKISKVIIGTHTILAEGGCKVPCGIFNVVHAAKEHKVPVFVCAASYKLCPDQFRSEQEPGFQKWDDPTLFLPREETVDGDVEIGCVMFEYISPEYIQLFFFEIGVHPPSHVYGLVKDIYHPEDISLEDK